MNKLGGQLVDLLYPRRCPFCHEIILEQNQLICGDCGKIVNRYYLINQPACCRCGKALWDSDREYCRDCSRHIRSFDGGISVFLYGQRRVPMPVDRKTGYERHSMGESILRFKFDNAREYGDYYIEQVLEQYSEQLSRWKPDVIIPIPIHPSKMKTRGYNQAEVLAKKLSTAIQVPMRTDLLVRKQKTKPQKELNDEERLRNLTAAFAMAGRIPDAYQRILLVDDIFTTGSTMEACTRRLKEQGPRQVYILSICSGANGN